MDDNNNDNNNNDANDIKDQEEIKVFYKPPTKDNAIKNKDPEDVLPIENQLKKIVDYLEEKLVQDPDPTIGTQEKTPEEQTETTTEVKELLIEKEREERIKQILEPETIQKKESFSSHIQQVKEALESILPIDEQPDDQQPADKQNNIEPPPTEQIIPEQLSVEQPVDEQNIVQQALDQQSSIQQTPTEQI
ncbi:hypothetical protein KAI68_02675, partial [bacterium]|nr:hypothetical protein [bacterium]